ncbi:MAG: FHA domain-containing protein [Planctomycetaceae bacterium]
MLGELIPRGGGDPIPLLKPRLLIGRRSACDVCLRFPNISSHHCQLELINGYWYVRDLGSSNGIKVNGTRCESKWLMPGDILSVAKHHYELSYTPTSDGPPPEDADPFALSLLEKAGLAKPRTEPSPSEKRSPKTSSSIDRPDLPPLKDDLPHDPVGSDDIMQDQDSDWFMPAKQSR